MEPAAVVTIIAVLVVVAALVFFLVSIILELIKITRGLDIVLGYVGQIVTKTAPVNDVAGAIVASLAKGRDLLENLLVKKAGVEDAAGVVESVFPGAGPAVLARHGRRGTKVPYIAEVYSRGAAQLARLGRGSPIGASHDKGPAVRDPHYQTTQVAKLYPRPWDPEDEHRPRPKSPVIGSDAPVAYTGGGNGGGGEGGGGTQTAAPPSEAPPSEAPAQEQPEEPAATPGRVSLGGTRPWERGGAQTAEAPPSEEAPSEEAPSEEAPATSGRISLRRPPEQQEGPATQEQPSQEEATETPGRVSARGTRPWERG
ncbi:MAG: hypothetical protein M3296_05930 [Actinomycetota bacterium]|nr:hypothetical protein [Actinomycetota bacterium]